MAKNIISKGKDVDNAFEYATQYLFEKILGFNLVKQENSDHSDGCIEFDRTGNLFMWDNKSLSDGKAYTFPEPHLTQFKRYIRDADNRLNKKVKTFLVIVPLIDESAELNTYKLKKESGQDTDVAIIEAKELKILAESWKKNNPEKQFDLEFFNHTGVLDREVIKKRSKIFLS